MEESSMSDSIDDSKNDEKRSQKHRNEGKVDLNSAVTKKSRTLPASVIQPTPYTQSSPFPLAQYTPTEYKRSLTENDSATSNNENAHRYANTQRSTIQYSTSFSDKLLWSDTREDNSAGKLDDITSLPPTNVTYSLSKSQKKVIDMIMQRKSVFFTGAAGTGKSYILRILREIMENLGLEHKIVFTAPTGVAACNIRGMTIHSWSGVGKASESMEVLIGMVIRNSNASKRWKEVEMLVIDEVSMLSSELFDKLDIIGRRVRNNQQPFGGIQVVLCGDFFQLPPIGIGRITGQNFCFVSNAWQEIFASYYHQHDKINKTAKMIKNSMIVLQRVFRQQEDRLFLTILQELRMGIISSQAHSILQRKVNEAKTAEQQEQAQTQHQQDGQQCGSEQLSEVQHDLQLVQPTKLFSVNEDVDRYNSLEMERLAEFDNPENRNELKTFFAQDYGKEPFLSQLKNGLKAPYQLILRRGAQVMLLKNLSTEIGLVNGARGTVIGFEKNYASSQRGAGPAGVVNYPYLPIVKFSLIRGTERREEIVVIKEDTWDIKLADRVMACRVQIPLMLAWAISIHKSQGMTIPLLEVSCQRMFEYGQAYVALSRATCLQGLTLRSFQPSVVKAHPAVKTFYEKLVQWEREEVEERDGQSNESIQQQDEDSIIKVSLQEFVQSYRRELDMPVELNTWMGLQRQTVTAASTSSSKHSNSDEGEWKNIKPQRSDLEKEFFQTDIATPKRTSSSISNSNSTYDNNRQVIFASKDYSGYTNEVSKSSSSCNSRAGREGGGHISISEGDGRSYHLSKQLLPQGRNIYHVTSASTQQLQSQSSQNMASGLLQGSMQEYEQNGQSPQQANHCQIEKIPLSAELKRKIEENRQAALKKFELFKKRKEQEETKSPHAGLGAVMD